VEFSEAALCGPALVLESVRAHRLNLLMIINLGGGEIADFIKNS